MRFYLFGPIRSAKKTQIKKNKLFFIYSGLSDQSKKPSKIKIKNTFLL